MVAPQRVDIGRVLLATLFTTACRVVLIGQLIELGHRPMVARRVCWRWTPSNRTSTSVRL
jgi:hypothetical protein